MTKDTSIGGSMLADATTRSLPFAVGLIGAAGAGVLVPGIIYSSTGYIALGIGLIVACLAGTYGAYRLRMRHEAIVKEETARTAARKAAKKAAKKADS